MLRWKDLTFLGKITISFIFSALIFVSYDFAPELSALISPDNVGWVLIDYPLDVGVLVTTDFSNGEWWSLRKANITQEFFFGDKIVFGDSKNIIAYNRSLAEYVEVVFFKEIIRADMEFSDLNFEREGLLGLVDIDLEFNESILSEGVVFDYSEGGYYASGRTFFGDVDVFFSKEHLPLNKSSFSNVKGVLFNAGNDNILPVFLVLRI